MNNQPLVSVIMNCYNSDEYLIEAIDSVISQHIQIGKSSFGIISQQIKVLK